MVFEIPFQLKNKDFRFVLVNSREKKPIEVEWQTKNNYTFDNPKLISHLNSGGNYNIICGLANLRVLDCDNPEFAAEIQKKLPLTFTIKTGKGGMHFYFYSDYDTNHVLIEKKGELRCKNYMVVCPGSIHPNGNKYEIVNESNIVYIQSKNLKEILKPYINNEFITTTQPGENKPFDNSRSGREFREIIRLLRKGYSKDKIFQDMNVYAKWVTAHPGYRELSYLKAEAFVKSNPIKEEVALEKAINLFADKLDLARKFLEIQPLYYDRTKIWWIWNFKEFKWEIIDETDILNAITTHSGADTISSKNRVEIIEALKQKCRLNKPTESNKNWVQFKDKIIDIKTGEEIEATPKYFVKNPISWDIGESEETPIMDRIFTEWVGDEYIRTLYEILAYSMICDYPIHRIFCFVGSGLNGKSCFLRLLRRFIGEDNVTSTELDTLLKSHFEITRLHKKLVCMMGETNFNEITYTSKLKQLTGQDLIGFEYKNKNPFEDYNYAKILISTNNLPATTDKTIGFYRRWMIIDFPNTFAESEDILDSIPEWEYNNLAKKSVRILRELIEKREFWNEGNIEERTKRYEDRSNPLDKFLKENTEEDVDGIIFKFEFRKRLDLWCKSNRFRAITDTSLGTKMKERGYMTSQKLADWYSKEGNKPILRCWEGLKWIDPSKND